MPAPRSSPFGGPGAAFAAAGTGGGGRRYDGSRIMARRHLFLTVLMAASLALAAFFPVPAAAERRGSLSARVAELEKDLQAIKRYLARVDLPERQGAPAQGEGGAAVGDADYRAQIEVRLGELEQQLRTLTGQMEEASHRIDLLSRRLEAVIKDVEFRLGELERAAGAVAAAQAGAPPAPEAGSETGAKGGAEGVPTASQPPPATEAPPPSEPPPAMSDQELYDDARAKLRREDYAGAERGFKALLERFPDSTLVPNAQYWLGESYYVRGDYENAARAFLKGYQNYGDSEKGPASLLKLGVSLYGLGQKDDACAVYRQFLSRYPDAAPTLMNRIEAEQKRAGCS